MSSKCRLFPRSPRSLLAGAIVTLLGAFTSLNARGGEREWTSTERGSIEAELLGTDGASAVFRMAGEGKIYVLPVERLSNGDRERVLNSTTFRLPEVDLSQGPTEDDVARFLGSEPSANFAPVAAHLRHRLLSAYGEEHDATLGRWYYFYRWLDLFQEGPAHADLRPGSGRFGEGWPRSLRAFVLGDAGFSREFFGTISAEDRSGEVSAILRQIFQSDREAFDEYKSLALAIAIVYDEQPPSNWPVSGVPDDIYPSGLPDPVEAFEFFVSSREAGRLMIDPRRLSARDLRHAVDIIAPFDELSWAQQRIRLSVGRFENAYSMIEYDYARYSPELRELDMDWPHSDYRLETIRRNGGICTDQAYFASQCGKARGLPTVYFSGAGDQGRHAWVGHLEGPRRGWNLNVGRYEQDDYVIGHARDPQSWDRVSDREIAFAAERFHRTERYRASRYHSGFGREFRLEGRRAAALRAARRAIEIEPRNREAWDLVIDINRASGRRASYESALEMAADAFRHYSHFEALYLGRLIESLVDHEEMEEAFALLQEVIRKNRRERSDISVAHSARLLEIARASGDTGQLVRDYRQVLSTLASDTPGGIFFEEVARPFLTHLNENGEGSQARVLFSRTRNQLRPGRGTLLDRRMDRLEKMLR